MSLLPDFPADRKFVIGMVHLRPLPGSPGFGGDAKSLLSRALADAETLAAGGVHALMLENFGDAPFFPGCVPSHVVADMTAIAMEVRRRVQLPLGVNVLRNDGQSALAVAHAAGGSFIRVNILCGARITDQGLIQGIAHDLLRDRALLRAGQIKILADINVKHSAPLAPRPLSEEVADTIHRGLADAIIVTGPATGEATDPDDVSAAKRFAGDTPVLVGSGVTAENAGSFLPHASGFIVGSEFKRDGIVSNPVDSERVRRFLKTLRS